MSYATIEPELHQFLSSISLDVARHAVVAGDIAGMRRASAAARMPWQAGGPSIPYESVDVLGVPARLFRSASSEASPLLVYLHGGGWVMLGAETHDRLLREYAVASGWAVLALDYPLAPEFPFPRALDAIASALGSLAQVADVLGLDVGRLVIAGDSSGANLALALALQSPSLPIIGLVSIYGVFDSDTTRKSYREHGGVPHLLTADKMQFFWASYCQRNDDRDNPLAAPLRASDGQLGALPPVCMIIAGQDVLADENEAMAARLESLGRQPLVLRYPNATHAFMEALAISPSARKALDASVHWLQQLDNATGGGKGENSSRNTPRGVGKAAEFAGKTRQT